jgi:lactoylglutathione lyase
MFFSLTPNLMVQDVRQTITFYQDQLDFELDAWVESETTPDCYDWAMIHNGPVVLMLQSADTFSKEYPKLKAEHMGQSLSLFIKVLSIDGFLERLKDQVEIACEPTTTFYGTREFSFYDCNGYIITLAEDAPDGPSDFEP